jgi:hypothetical protein
MDPSWIDGSFVLGKGNMAKISRKFWTAVKLHPRAQYKLAWEAGVHPVVLSQILNGYIHPKKGDPRVTKIGGLLGLAPAECFEGDGP